MAEPAVFDDLASHVSLSNDVVDRPNPLNGFGSVAVPRSESLPAHFVPPSGSIRYNRVGPIFGNGYTGMATFNQFTDHFDLYFVPEMYKVQITGSCLEGSAKQFYKRWKVSFRTLPVSSEQFRADSEDVFSSGINKTGSSGIIFETATTFRQKYYLYFRNY